MSMVGTWVSVGLAVVAIAVAIAICLWQNKRSRRAQPDLETGAVAVGALQLVQHGVYNMLCPA